MRDSASFERWPTVAPLTDWLAATFGVTSDLSAHAVWESGGGALWIASAAVVLPPFGAVSAVGLPVSRVQLHRGQLSTPFMRRFCAGATRNVCDLDDASAFLDGRPVACSDPWPEGQRIVRAGGRVLGRGRRRGDRLECELPKALRALAGVASGSCPNPSLE